MIEQLSMFGGPARPGKRKKSNWTAAQQRAWRAKNILRVRANEAIYRARRRDAHRKWMQEWRARNPAKLKAIARRRTLKQYGISEEEYQRLLLAQDGKCGICRQAPPLRKTRSGRRYERFDIDHDHTTQKVRGLLCCNCNAILGHARDVVSILQSAISYIEHHR